MITGFLNRYSHINWAIADQAIVSGVNFLTGIILARYLGLTGFGIYSLVWMAVLFVNSIQLAMISSPMMSLGPKIDSNTAAEYFGAVFMQQIVFSALTFILLYAGVKYSDLFFPQWGIQDLALPLSLAASSFQIQDFIRRYFFARNSLLLAFTTDAISYLGKLTILIYFSLTHELTTRNALFIIAITSSVAIVIAIYYIKNIKFKNDMLLGVVRKHWKFSKWLTASELMKWSSNQLFIIVTGIVLGASAVGGLRAALNIVGVAHILFQGLENVVPVRSAQHFHYGGKKRLSLYLKKVTIFCSTLTIVLCGLLVISPDYLFKFIYNVEYIPYSYLLYWVSCIYIVMSFALPLRAGLRAIEDTRAIFISYLWSGIFTIIFSYPIAARFGLNGIMLGMLVIQIGVVAILLYNYIEKQKAYVRH